MNQGEGPAVGDPADTGSRDEPTVKGRRSTSGRNRIEGTTTAHTLSQEALVERKRQDQRFVHEERAKDNAQRRLFANVAGVLLVMLLVGSFLVAAFSSQSDSRSRAWDLVTLLVSGVVAAIAGYLAGKAGS